MIKRKQEILLPNGSTEILPGDLLLIFSSQAHMKKLTDMMGISV